MSAPRVLPADVFDALELSALAFGGIGRGRYAHGEDTDALRDGSGSPCCVVGHCAMLTGEGVFGNEALRALSRIGIGEDENDDAVPKGRRLSWPAYCAKLNIVRGES